MEYTFTGKQFSKCDYVTEQLKDKITTGFYKDGDQQPADDAPGEEDPGVEDAANERLLRVKAEQENAKLKSGKPAAVELIDESKQRAQRDLDEFRKAYPDVALTEDLLTELLPEIQNSVSMLQSYRKREIAQKDAVIAEKEQKIAQLERQIEAENAAKNGRTCGRRDHRRLYTPQS